MSAFQSRAKAALRRVARFFAEHLTFELLKHLACWGWSHLL